MLRLLIALNARLAHQRGRALLAALGIALGVALGFAVHLINRAAVGELAAAVRAVAGDADLEVRGGRGGFPEALYPRLAQLPGVAAASPVLELEAALAGADGEIRVVGIDALRAARLQPALLGIEPERRLALLEPDKTFITPQSARALGLGEGDRLRLVVGLRMVELEIAGVLPAGVLPGAAALTDLATAQWRLDRLGELNRVDLRLSPGTDPATLRTHITQLLPPGVHVVSVDAEAAKSANPSRAYRVNLNVLAMIALFTGGFLVFSAQALEIARRRGEHALLRVLGLERARLAQLVLAEAAGVGLAGSLLGLALGYALAHAAIRVAGADLGAGMFRGVTPELAFSPAIALLYASIGVGIALAGALVPALDAARVPPAQALKSGDEARVLGRAPSLWPGLVLLAAGIGLARLGPIEGIPVFGYLAIACLLVGGIALMPRISRAVLRVLPLPRQVPLALALAQLRGAPGQAIVSLAAIVASFALMVAMAIMVASFRQSVDDWLDRVLPADLYFRTSHAGETAYFQSEFEARVRALPQVARAEFLRSARVSLDPSRQAVSLIARELPAQGAPALLPLVGERYAPRGADPPAIWVSEAVAELYGFVPGKRVELPIGGTRYAFVVAGIWRDYARQHGAIVLERALYTRLTGDARANDAALWLAPGTGVGEAVAALRALPGGEHIDIGEPGEIRRRSLRIFDRSFAVTYALEAVAVLVGLFGLSSSLGAIVLARRREFGMLRHLGMTRLQIGAMLAAEGGFLALLGAAAGLAVGSAISLVLVYVVNRQSFNWTMDLHPPYGMLALLAAVIVLLAALTAYFSGREAMGMAPVRAVREDW